MSNIRIHLALIILSLLGLPLAALASEDPSELVHINVPSRVSIEGDTVRIEIGKTKVFTVENKPDFAVIQKALNLETPILEYEKLNDQMQAKFLERRLLFLKRAAQALNATRLGIGFGMVVGDSASWIKNKVTRKPTDPKGGPLRDRTDAVIQRALRNIDYQMWSQAGLVADANEFSLMASVGIIGETGKLDKGFGGAEELGMILALNKSESSLAFEIFHSSERFLKSKLAFVVGGVYIKLGFGMANRVANDRSRVQTKGSVFYPPGAPMFSLESPTEYVMGLSSSLGFPPPPLADVLTYTNEFNRSTLFIRFFNTKIFTDFFVVQVGPIKEAGRNFSQSVKSLYSFIRERLESASLFHRGSRQCQAIF